MTYFKPTKILTLFNNVLYTVHIETVKLKI